MKISPQTAAVCVGSLMLGFGLYIASQRLPRAERTKPGKRHLACIGDSITFGAGVVWSQRRDAWPYRMNRLLGEDWQVLNLGVSGATAQDEADFPYGEHGFLKAVVEIKPELTLLMLGTNDSKPYNWNAGRYERDIYRMIEELHGNSGRLVLLFPPKVFPGKDGTVAYDIRNETIRDEILPVLRDASEKYSLPAIDLYAFTEEHPEYYGDGVHPNSKGSLAIADFVLGELRRMALV